MAKYPLFERSDGTRDVKLAEGWKILTKRQEGKVLWLNFFKIDWQTIIMIGFILLIVFAYKHDTAQCKAIIEKPCVFCAKSGCCQRSLTYYAGGLTNDSGMPSLNLS